MYELRDIFQNKWPKLICSFIHTTCKITKKKLKEKYFTFIFVVVDFEKV